MRPSSRAVPGSPGRREPGREIAALLLAGFALSCGAGLPEGEAEGGVRQSIVVITLSGLRPDAVGALRATPALWTPHIDALAREADWVGSSVAASSAPAVALVSLMTGVSPWHHQVLSHAPTAPRPEVPLLAETLAEVGYRTVARVPFDFDLRRFGLHDGFEDVAEIEPIEDAAAVFDRPDDGAPELLWFHLREAAVAFERRDAYLPRLGPAADLPHRLQAWRLLQYADPRRPLPADEREVAWRLFCHEVAWADHQVGQILEALRASGRWDRAWVIVTASQGMELGEHSQMLYAQNLGRESIEVPLIIKLPRSLRGSLALADGTRVSQLRLWATLVEAAGGRPEPIRAPSLSRAVTPPIASELYKRNGVNEFSLLEGDLQLLWTTRFAPAEPEFYHAQLASWGGKPPLSEPPRHILERLRLAFDHTPPLSGLEGGSPPRLRLERWTADGRIERIEDRRRAEEMALELHRRWLRHVDRERTPAEESSLSTPPG